MKLLIVLGLAAVALGDIIVPHTAFNYHDSVGVSEAVRIKAVEDGIDFDGSRIAGGSNANLGQYPHMGGLVITLTDGRQSVCGSSLLTNNRIVTAAHCWFDGRNQARQFTVVLGSVRIFSGGTRINTNQVTMHPQWNFRNAANDVAVGVISWVGFSNTINRINLASGSNQFVGVWADAAGFGRTADNVGIGSNQALSHVRLQVISNADCARTFGGNIIASTICTSGAGGRSVCGGDSGGPLQTGNQLIGIVSFGSILGCTRGFPAAYARVTAFESWIRSRL